MPLTSFKLKTSSARNVNKHLHKPHGSATGHGEHREMRQPLGQRAPGPSPLLGSANCTIISEGISQALALGWNMAWSWLGTWPKCNSAGYLSTQELLLFMQDLIWEFDGLQVSTEVNKVKPWVAQILLNMRSQLKSSLSLSLWIPDTRDNQEGSWPPLQPG